MNLLLAVVLTNVPAAARYLPNQSDAHADEREPRTELLGRILDEKLQPVARTSLCCTVWLEGSGASSARGQRVTSDEGGRFRCDVPAAMSDFHSLRRLAVSAWDADDAAVARFGDAMAIAEITTLSAGVHDLGDLVASAPGSNVLLKRLEDAELEARFALLLDWKSRGGSVERDLEACLGGDGASGERVLRRPSRERARFRA